MSNKIKDILSEYVEGLIKIIGKDLKKVILYSSYARGEQDKNGEISDIDSKYTQVKSRSSAFYFLKKVFIK